jgi:hypothetical protein
VAAWVIALPLTSAPAAFIIAHNLGLTFTSQSATSMLAATTSQLLFVLFYRANAKRGVVIAFLTGCLGFAISTLLLLQINLTPTTALLIVIIFFIPTLLITKGDIQSKPAVGIRAIPFELPVKMLVATVVVFVITQLAPHLGPSLAGLLSPFPILAAILAIFAHLQGGEIGGKNSLAGLAAGLLTPAVFFFILATTLIDQGYIAFIYASIAGITTQIISSRYVIKY